jgi:2'-5' RNA ligase
VIRTIGVAIAIPEPWATQLNDARLEAGDPLAASVPAHITLLPPTELTEAERKPVDEHLAEAASRHRPFELHLRGTGSFRPVTDVVFVAVATGISECELLEAEIRRGPLDRELRFPYHPHVTVAHDVPGESLDRAYDGLGDFDARFTVRGFTLFEHGDDGRWRPEREFPFGGEG